ncbi:hypothetical protein ACVMB0_006242 [Bradyrhizobium sp. USDA 4451]
MKHSSSREYFAYWNAKRGTARAPDRSEFEPSAVRELLSDIFVLSYDGETRFPFRVAGTRTSALLGCDLKNQSFSALFGGESRGEIEDIITCVVEETLPAIAGITATTEAGAKAHLELLLLPFTARVHMPASLTGPARPVRGGRHEAARFGTDLVALPASPGAVCAADPAQARDRARPDGLRRAALTATTRPPAEWRGPVACAARCGTLLAVGPPQRE